MKKLLLLLALLPCLALAQFKGTGLNTHAQLLPIAQLQEIGVHWVRADLDVGKATEAKARAVIKHYAPMPVLWMLDNREPDPVGTAKKLYRAGVRHLEVSNEGDGDWFRAMPPEEVADRFLKIRYSVPRTMKLYGPTPTTWNPDYIQRFLDRIKDHSLVDGISVHLYMAKPEQMAGYYLECWKRWGLPMICTEVGITPNMPVKMTAPDLFMAIRKNCGLLPVCYYDGPNANADKTVGLFDWAPETKARWKPTPTYDRIWELIEHPD